jgi:hypothetical protein
VYYFWQKTAWATLWAIFHKASGHPEGNVNPQPTPFDATANGSSRVTINWGLQEAIFLVMRLTEPLVELTATLLTLSGERGAGRGRAGGLACVPGWGRERQTKKMAVVTCSQYILVTHFLWII